MDGGHTAGDAEPSAGGGCTPRSSHRVSGWVGHARGSAKVHCDKTIRKSTHIRVFKDSLEMHTKICMHFQNFLTAKILLSIFQPPPYTQALAPDSARRLW